MDKKFMEVIRRMQDYLDEEQLKQLQGALNMVFCDCEIVQKTELMLLDDSWQDDMEDFLIIKALAGKSVSTIGRYRYELKRLLSYICKPVINITSADINTYLELYKKVRKVSNATLKNVRAVYSSFFLWLQDSNRITTNPMKQVVDIKVEFIKKEPFTDEQREKLMRSCDELRDKAIMEFLYSTVVRVSECVSLNRSDI